MIGIQAFGAYVPLAYEEIAKAWNTRAGKAERSIAVHDEDSLTMAVEASVAIVGPED